MNLHDNLLAVEDEAKGDAEAAPQRDHEGGGGRRRRYYSFLKEYFSNFAVALAKLVVAPVTSM